MADISYSEPRLSWVNRVLAAVADALTGVNQAIAVSRDCDARLRQIDKLQAKSDADLAEMGLTRDDIVRHVFRDIYYI